MSTGPPTRVCAPTLECGFEEGFATRWGKLIAMRSRVLGRVVCAGVVWCGAARAQAFDLTRAPLEGADVSDLAYDPNTPDLVYAAVAGTGLYVSKDGGLTFREQPLPGTFRHEPRVVLPSRSDKGLLLVCEPGENGVLRSEDGGKTFTKMLATKDLGCTALTEGNTPGTYYATSYTKEAITLHTSQDSGKTWAPQPLSWSTTQSVFDQTLKVAAISQLPSGRLVLALADQAPYFPTGSRGRLAYCDDGSTLIDTKSATQQVWTLASNGSMVLAFAPQVSNPDLWSSPDGASWTKSAFSFGSSTYSQYLGLEYVASRDDFVALGGNRLLTSTAGTYAFDAAKPLERFFGLALWRSLAADPFNAANWLLGTERGGEGVFRRSSPTTNEWTLASGFESANVDIALRDAKSGYLYALSLRGGRVWAGANGARSLQLMFRNRDLPYVGATLTALGYDHADPQHLVLALHRSRDSDFMDLPELWELSNLTTAAVEVWVKAPDPMTPTNGQAIGALFVDGALRLIGFQSTVSGATAPAQSIYRSTDGGKSYAPLSLQTSGSLRFIERGLHTPQVFYVGAGEENSTADPKTQGLFRSLDGGETWAPLGPPSSASGFYPRSIVFDPDDAQRFWVASRFRVWQTLDAGASFTEIAVPDSDNLGLAYSAPRKRLLITQAGGVLEREISDTASWTSAAKLSATPNSLLADGSGVATDAGLFVISDILGAEAPSHAGSGGQATNSRGGSSSGGPSSGGSTRGGSSSGGGTSANANVAGSSASGTASVDGTDTPGSAGDSSACGCRFPRGSRQNPTLMGITLALALIGRRRVRRPE